MQKSTHQRKAWWVLFCYATFVKVEVSAKAAGSVILIVVVEIICIVVIVVISIVKIIVVVDII